MVIPSLLINRYYQVGKVVDSPADRYSDRVPNKERKSTLVDELMADAQFQKYSKRRYAEILEERSRGQRRFQPRNKRKKDK